MFYDLELISTTNQPEGTSYSIKLTNKSGHIIRQNNIYLSFPFKTQNGIQGNPFKIDANGNKLNIKDKEELVVNAFAPKKTGTIAEELARWQLLFRLLN
jgi:hypothetical protein